MRRITLPVAALATVAMLVTVGVSRGASLRLPGSLPKFSHVVVIVMENREYPSIIGSSKAPYINSLAQRYASASSFYATTHSSLPNYLAMLSGQTFGLSTTCTTCHFNAPNLVDQLEGAGISWKAYMDGAPSACFTGATYGTTYAKKHNPFVYFDDITGNPARCAKVVPMTRLSTDLTNGALPTFAWITPDLCHDMHDCTVATGDQFLSTLVPPILDALGKNGVLFLTWDEGTTTAGCCTYATGGHIATIVAGPGARSGVTSSKAYDHYSILRTIEDAWGLARLANAACSCSAPMKDLIKTTLL